MTDKEKKQEKENVNTLITSSSPHAHSGESVTRIMLDVIIALIPALLVSIYFFGGDAIRLTVTCVLSCLITEVVSRTLMKRDAGILDLSAVITGLLLAFNLPPELPSWMAVVGSVFAIGIAKQLFGGIGYNPFNPALIGRVALLISFPAAMTSWSRWRAPGSDALTSATPLGMAKEAIIAGKEIPFTCDPDAAMQFLFGNMNGCIGEASALALIIGGIYLLCRKVITWHIPTSFIGTVALFASLLWLTGSDTNLPPLFHLLSGGLMLGAVFMATDMVTSPVTKKGMLIFGTGCGLLTMIIRKYGGYPEGVSFAILLMNALTPLINRATKPTIFGAQKK